MGYIQTICRTIEDEEIRKIAAAIKTYHRTFKDMAECQIGKYTINQMLELAEEGLNYLEVFTPSLSEWAEKYLTEHRGEIWLYDGIKQGNYYAEYWKIDKTNLPELQGIWPFLYAREVSSYKGFVIDLEDAQHETIRQRDRGNTSNPKYKPFHPDGCPSRGCSCWMLDDMEQWYEEEQAEIRSSKNVFFNKDIQDEFYNAALEDLELLRPQWDTYRPKRDASKNYENEAKNIDGLTPVHIIRTWLKDMFIYSPFAMFDWSENFHEVWNNIDSVSSFISSQRKRLKTILDLL
jgi:hypothetical protein